MKVFYSEKHFEDCQRLYYGLKGLADEKLKITSSKGLCFVCEERIAKFPTQQSIKDFNIVPKYPCMCATCFIKFFVDDLETIEKFGSVEMNFSLSEKQKERNKQIAKKLLETIRKNSERFAERYELGILNMIKRGGEELKFFEDN